MAQHTTKTAPMEDFLPDIQARSAPHPLYGKLAQKNPKFSDHLSITLGVPMIVIFDLLVPCIIYYVWFKKRRSWCLSDCQNHERCCFAEAEFDKHILGYAIISFGLGELYVLAARTCRLLWHQKECAPLLSRSRWELDATSWVYGISMICALIPFVIGSSKEIPILYLYSPAFLMSFLGILMLVTLVPFNIPIGIDSQARGTPLRPFVYYAAEDFIAVDGLQDREFRIRLNLRYDSSKAFRRMFLFLTVWWILGISVYLGCLSAIIWTLEFHFAFGLSLGTLFAYIIVWAVTSYFWIRVEMKRQQKTYERSRV